MTREEQNQAQALDLEERRQVSEAAFQALYPHDKLGSINGPRSEALWAIIASEMGLSEFYRKLKEGR